MMSGINSSSTEDLAKERTKENDATENSCKKRKLGETADAMTSSVSSPAKEEDEDSSDDEVQIVDRPASWVVTPDKPIDKSDGVYDADTEEEDDEDGVQVVGTVNAVQLPHMRCHCTTAPFREVLRFISPTIDELNAKSCDLCYCYVCDVPVKECLDWKSSHCNATDQGFTSMMWRFQRTSRQQNNNIPAAPVETTNIIQFEASLPNTKQLLKEVLSALNQADFDDITLRCDAQGIRFTEMQGTHNSMVSYRLDTNAFQKYKCTQPLIMSICIKDLLSSLKVTKQKEIVTFVVRTNNDVLKMTRRDHLFGTEIVTLDEVDFHRLDNDEVLLTVPDVVRTSYTTLNTTLLKRTLTTLTKIAKDESNCIISWGYRDGKSMMSLSAHGTGTVQRGNFGFMSNDGVGTHSIKVVVKEELTDSFRLGPLISFARFLGTRQVCVSTCPDNKLALEYTLRDQIDYPAGMLTFYLPTQKDI